MLNDHRIVRRVWKIQKCIHVNFISSRDTGETRIIYVWSHMLMNNSVFRKTMENVRKHRDTKLVTTDEKINKLLSEPDYHITKRFSESFLAIEAKITEVKMKKSI